MVFPPRFPNSVSETSTGKTNLCRGTKWTKHFSIGTKSRPKSATKIALPGVTVGHLTDSRARPKFYDKSTLVSGIREVNPAPFNKMPSTDCDLSERPSTVI